MAPKKYKAVGKKIQINNAAGTLMTKRSKELRDQLEMSRTKAIKECTKGIVISTNKSAAKTVTKTREITGVETGFLADVQIVNERVILAEKAGKVNA